MTKLIAKFKKCGVGTIRMVDLPRARMNKFRRKSWRNRIKFPRATW